MWIISKQNGVFNADKLSAIKPPHPADDYKRVDAGDGQRGYRITHGDDNYQKIVDAIRNGDTLVEVD